jgi:hypothetical protein
MFRRVELAHLFVFAKETTMATETTTETNHPHAHTNGSHKSNGHKPRAKAKTSRRHSHARGSGHLGRLAESLSLGGLPASVADGLTEQLGELKDKGLQSAKAVEQSIMKHPKSSVLIALSVGYLWGRLRRWL